ncbi:acetyl-CoA synthetase-like protein [Ceraceosorus guamensis]|uniref:Acetyl-CoA synthetase-like protein n=1 Tax=Ceraceosorus guamensis TaxID=1522189 RepID=A0A316VYP8_9BASI|nr:acetyl-CoA synthetase-like protein [Ceraceosorus guamensis]PWN42579.1 acetyl-CoA synthetase-like protein [Ceraceosorus guamensis]
MHPQNAIHRQSLEARDDFWLKASKDISWHLPPTTAYGKTDLSRETAPYAQGKTWFPNAQLNTCFNALDRHVYPPPYAGAPPLTPSPHTPHLAIDSALSQRIAFHHVSPLPFQKQQYRAITYGAALEYVQTLAGVLKSKGLKKGDTVIIYMPMIPETALAMLACARLGAIHSVVFGGFAARELAKRIDDSRCKLVLSASCGLEPRGPVEYKPLVDAAFGHCKHKPQGLLFLARNTISGHEPPRIDARGKAGVPEWDWEDELRLTREGVDGRHKCWSCVPVASEEPVYILYTSGTTGTPKGVTRLTGGHAVGLRYSIEHAFGMKPSDTMLCASDLGWVVGHSYILYAPLFLGASTCIFEGKPVTPDAGILWRTISALGVTHLFTAPTALRAVRGQDPSGQLMRSPSINLRTLRALFLAGERSEPTLVSFYQKRLREIAAPGFETNDNYWQTESGSPITALMLGSAWHNLPCIPGSAGLAQPGMDVRIVDDAGNEIREAGKMGNLVVAPPLSPTFLGGLWNNQAGFHDAYWSRFQKQGWFDTGDAAVMDEEGYITILARSDDIIQVAGHRLGTGLLEQVLTSHPDVLECCVVGAPEKTKGTVPFALVVARSDRKEQDVEAILKNVNEHLRAEVGPIAQLGALVLTSALPKTRSGKTLRKVVRVVTEQAAEGKSSTDISQLPVPPTIESIDAVHKAVEAIEKHFAIRTRL